MGGLSYTRRFALVLLPTTPSCGSHLGAVSTVVVAEIQKMHSFLVRDSYCAQNFTSVNSLQFVQFSWP